MHFQKHSKETKLKISEKLKGRKLLENTKAKISKTMKGMKRPKRVKQIVCLVCKKEFYPKRKTSIYCSNSCSAKAKGGNPKNMIPFKKGQTPWNKGKAWLEMRGKNHPNYKGTTPELTRLRHSWKYIRWRKAVFKRDNYTCQDCRVLGGKLNADHIIPISIDKTKVYELDNGRTLCEDCHKKTLSYLNRWYERKVLSFEVVE